MQCIHKLYKNSHLKQHIASSMFLQTKILKAQY